MNNSSYTNQSEPCAGLSCWSTVDNAMNRSWATAVEEMNRSWATAAEEMNRSWATAAEEMNRSWATAAEEMNRSWVSVAIEMNRRWAGLMTPVIAMMITFMAVGTVGNSFVLIVYSYRKHKTSANIFIMFLASMDLFACVIIHPYIIYKAFNSYTQTWVAACKVFEFFVHCNLALSGLTLMLVAIDRYLAICCPVKFLRYDKHIMKAILSVSCLAFIISLPLLEFYGAAPADPDIVKGAVIGFRCHYQTKYQTSPIMMAFGSFIMCGFITEIIAMAILYKSVAVTAYQSRRTIVPLSNAHVLAGIRPAGQMQGTPRSRNTQTTDISVRSRLSYSEQNSGETFSDGPKRDISSIFLVRANVPRTSNSDIVLQNNTSLANQAPATREPGRIFYNRLKAAKVLFFVTAVFFLSWMPFLVLRICGVVNPDFWSDKTSHELVLENILNHVFYLNNAANPIIYTLINNNFRRECKNVLRKRCNCLNP